MFQSVVDSAGLEKNQSNLQFSINHLHQHGKAPALKSTQKSKKYSIQAERSIQVETDGSTSVDEELAAPPVKNEKKVAKKTVKKESPDL